VSAKNLHGGRIQVINVCQIRGINHHPVESNEDRAPEAISDTKDWLRWIGDLDTPNDSEDDCAVDMEFDIAQDNSIEHPECPEQRDVSFPPRVRRLMRPTRKSMRQADKVLMMVNAIETRRNKGVKTM